MIMHIPDGWLSLPVSLATWGVTLLAIGFALSRFDRSDLDKLSNVGAVAAVIFVAQMFNFPVAGGTSGHLLGAALGVYIVGVPGAILALFIVLLVQAVVFADGGVLVLGANTFNLGVVGVLVAAIVIRQFSRYNHQDHPRRYLTGAFLAAVLSVVLSAFFAGLELALSGTTNFALSIPLILFWHLLIGVGEGIITVFTLGYMLQVDFPLADAEGRTSELSLVEAMQETNKPLIGLSVLLVALSILSLFASSNPDGLEFVGQTLNFGEGSSFGAGIADDYNFLGFGGILGTFLSAILGIFIIAGLFVLPAFYVKEQQRTVTN